MLAPWALAPVLLPARLQALRQCGGCGQVLGAAWGQARVPVYRDDLLAPSSEPVLMAALAARHSMCKLVVKQSILLPPGGSRENERILPKVNALRLIFAHRSANPDAPTGLSVAATLAAPWGADAEGQMPPGAGASLAPAGAAADRAREAICSNPSCRDVSVLRSLRSKVLHLEGGDRSS